MREVRVVMTFLSVAVPCVVVVSWAEIAAVVSAGGVRMSTRTKIAFGCYLAVHLLFAAFAAIYLLRPEFMPYHSVAVGMRWEEVGRPFQILILGLMRVVGGGLLGAAFVGAVLLIWPFRQGACWARWAIPIHGLIVACSSLYGTLYVELNTPAKSPWPAAAVAVVLLVLGGALSISSNAGHVEHSPARA
jgi:hypothetical protein